MTSRRGSSSKPSQFLPAGFDDSESNHWDPNSLAGAVSNLQLDEAEADAHSSTNKKEKRKKVQKEGSSTRSSKKTEGGGGGGGGSSYGRLFGPPSLPVDIPNPKRRGGDEVVDDGGGVRIPPNEYLPTK